MAGQPRRKSGRPESFPWSIYEVKIRCQLKFLPLLETRGKIIISGRDAPSVVAAQFSVTSTKTFDRIWGGIFLSRSEQVISELGRN
jgi:hypothetical protein